MSPPSKRPPDKDSKAPPDKDSKAPSQSLQPPLQLRHNGAPLTMQTFGPFHPFHGIRHGFYPAYLPNHMMPHNYMWPNTPSNISLFPMTSPQPPPQPQPQYSAAFPVPTWTAQHRVAAPVVTTLAVSQASSSKSSNQNKATGGYTSAIQTFPLV